MLRRDDRLLKPWEVAVVRIHLVAFPLLVLGVAFGFRLYGVLSSILMPIIQWNVLPDRQRQQILGRRARLR